MFFLEDFVGFKLSLFFSLTGNIWFCVHYSCLY